MMFGFNPKSVDGFLGRETQPEPAPATGSFNEAMSRQVREHSANQLRAAGENAALGVDRWNAITEPQRLLVRLALLFDGRDPVLAKEIRNLAAESIKHGLSCPRVPWMASVGL